MIINHNLNAMNAHRLMSGNTAGAGKAMEKLSSGLRINRAGDDAAGLAISEKMRAQIRGLDQASRNSQDGISMIQTAEGALNETHSILQRMRELAVQASNDTNVSTDRGEIQKEINQLTSEINRIGNSTEFNTQKLLKGDGSVAIDKTNLFTGAKLAGGLVINTQASSTVSMVTGASDFTNETFKVVLNGHELSVTFAVGSAAEQGISNITDSAAKITFATNAATATVATKISEALNSIILKNSDLTGNYSATAATDAVGIGATSTGAFAGAQGNIAAIVAGTGNEWAAETASIGTTSNIQATATIAFTSAASAADVIGKGMTINGYQIAFYDANTGKYTGDADFAVNVNGAVGASAIVSCVNNQLSTKIDGVTLSLTGGAASNSLSITANTGGTSGNTMSVSDGGVRTDFIAKFQVGANNGQSFQMNISDMRANALGLAGSAGATNFSSGLNVTDGTSSINKEAALDVSDHTKGAKAVEIIQSAIEKVSAQRSQLGAYQNRLEHTIANLGTSSENLSSAESRIRDVDMAKEMMTFSKNNILSQAAQAMLAQANQQPQGVLQLLR